MFVRGKRQNYSMDWRQMLSNYEERPRKCPLQIEITCLSVPGEISWHFQFSFAADHHFYLSHFHFRLLPGHLIRSAFAKRRRPCPTSLLIFSPSHLKRKCSAYVLQTNIAFAGKPSSLALTSSCSYMQAYLASAIIICMHAYALQVITLKFCHIVVVGMTLLQLPIICRQHSWH